MELPDLDTYLAAFNSAREQVLRLIRSGGLLGFRGPPRTEWTLVKSLGRAEELATSQDLDLVPVVWTDVYEATLSRANPARYEHRKSADRALDAWSTEVREWTEAFLPEPFWEMEESIAADLENIPNMRAAVGTASPLIEEMLAAYEAGGWPCGLDAEPPGGRLCVLWTPGLQEAVPPEGPRLNRTRLIRSKLRERLLAGYR
jgi:hypothetical protein